MPGRGHDYWVWLQLVGVVAASGCGFACGASHVMVPRVIVIEDDKVVGGCDWVCVCVVW